MNAFIINAFVIEKKLFKQFNYKISMFDYQIVHINDLIEKMYKYYLCNLITCKYINTN